MRWPVVEMAEWEELRTCPDCGRAWLTVWPEEMAMFAPPSVTLCPTREASD